MYEKELMMAILTSSTALAGLAAVVVGQVLQTKISNKLKSWFKVMLSLTLLLAIFAVLYSFVWFMSPEPSERIVASLCFGAELIVFVLLTLGFVRV